MRFKISAKRVLIVVVLLLSFFSIKKFNSTIRTSNAYNIECDKLFADDLQQNIINFINTHLKKKLPEEIYAVLIKQFPMIESIVVQRKNPNALEIKINSVTPIYRINDDLIATDKQKIFSKKYFTDSIDSLEKIEAKEVNDAFKQFLMNLPKDIPQQYFIVWESRNYIILKDKLDNQFAILIRYDHIPDKKVLEACKKIRGEIQDGQISKRKQKNRQMFADLRFTNQIVIFQN